MTLHSWEDLSDWLKRETPVNSTLLAELALWQVVTEDGKQPIAVSGCIAQEVEPYFQAYNLSVSKTFGSQFWPALYPNYPACLVDAVTFIEGEFNQLEQREMARARSKANRKAE